MLMNHCLSVADGVQFVISWSQLRQQLLAQQLLDVPCSGRLHLPQNTTSDSRIIPQIKIKFHKLNENLEPQTKKN